MQSRVKQGRDEQFILDRTQRFPWGKKSNELQTFEAEKNKINRTRQPMLACVPSLRNPYTAVDQCG